MYKGNIAQNWLNSSSVDCKLDAPVKIDLILENRLKVFIKIREYRRSQNEVQP